MKIHNINEFITSPDMSGYESPITMIASQMETKLEGDVMTAVQHYGIEVDKDELIKALNYDRQQYDKGYQNGYAAGYEKAKEDIANMFLRYPM